MNHRDTETQRKKAVKGIPIRLLFFSFAFLCASVSLCLSSESVKERMKILVANLGSTRFKYRLFDMNGERVLARGGVERIGAAQSPCFVEANGRREEATVAAKDHAVAVRLCLEQLSDPKRACLKDVSELAAIGFKAVHAQGVSGVQRVDEGVLRAMEAYADVAPAHNPPYIAAMRLLAKELPQISLVAAFETGFHETIPAAERL